MRIEAVLAAVPDTPAAALTDWIARGWIVPSGQPPDWRFSELDVARVRLVHDLRVDIGIEEEALPLVLSLLDQVYDLRQALHGVMTALDSQPPSVRENILAELRRVLNG